MCSLFKIINIINMGQFMKKFRDPNVIAGIPLRLKALLSQTSNFRDFILHHFSMVKYIFVAPCQSTTSDTPCMHRAAAVTLIRQE